MKACSANKFSLGARPIGMGAGGGPGGANHGPAGLWEPRGSSNEQLLLGRAVVCPSSEFLRNSEQCRLREALARLVDDVTRHAVGAASGVER